MADALVVDAIAQLARAKAGLDADVGAFIDAYFAPAHDAIAISPSNYFQYNLFYMERARTLLRYLKNHPSSPLGDVHNVLCDGVDTLAEGDLPAIVAWMAYYSPKQRLTWFRVLGPARLCTDDGANADDCCTYVTAVATYFGVRGTDTNQLHTILHDVPTCYHLFTGDITGTVRYQNMAAYFARLSPTWTGRIVLCGHSLGARLAYALLCGGKTNIAHAYLYAIGSGPSGKTVAQFDSALASKCTVVVSKFDLISALAYTEFPANCITTVTVRDSSGGAVYFPRCHSILNFVPDEICDAIQGRVGQLIARPPVCIIDKNPAIDVDRLIVSVLMQSPAVGGNPDFSVVPGFDGNSNSTLVWFHPTQGPPSWYTTNAATAANGVSYNTELWLYYSHTILPRLKPLLAALTTTAVIFAGYCVGGTLARWTGAIGTYLPDATAVRIVTFAEHIADDWTTPAHSTFVYRHYFSTFDVWAQCSVRFRFDGGCRQNVRVDDVNLVGVTLGALVSAATLTKLWTTMRAASTGSAHVVGTLLAFDAAKNGCAAYTRFHTLAYLRAMLEDPDRAATHAANVAELRTIMLNAVSV